MNLIGPRNRKARKVGVKSSKTTGISVLAGLFVLGAAASPALGQSYTLNLSGPPTATVGQPTMFQARGSNPPDDFFSSWLDVSAIPTSVLAACPEDYLNANQVARSAYAQGGEVVVTAQRENVDALGNFSLPFGYTPTKPGRFLLCGYTNDGATWTHVTSSLIVNVQGGSSPGPPPAPTATPAPRTGTPKPVNVKKPRVRRRAGKLARNRGRWSNAPERFSYRWLVNGKRMRGATGQTLRVTRRLKSRKVRCRVAATNAAGSTTALSRTLRVR
jgi:hypothetical protein